MVSPVWFQLKFYSTIGFRLEGAPDKKWIQNMRLRNGESGSDVKILPRFSLTDWSQQAYQIFLSNKEAVDKVATSVIQVVKQLDIDGIVFEYGYLPMPMVFDHMKLFLEKISVGLRSNDKFLVLVIPAPKQKDKILFEKNYIDLFDHVVDYYSLMSYDYSHPGPLAPLHWIKWCMNYYGSSKVLMGIHFYGYHGKDAITGEDYLKLMEEKPVKKWNKDAAEEWFKTKKGEVVYYPTKKSFKERLEVAKKTGSGIAIWELGQGLDEFFDLL
jgi:chitinase domain-containing protein 1